MGGIDDASVSTGDRDGSGEFDRVEEVLDIVMLLQNRYGKLNCLLNNLR
jgi:hypothetical protein